MATWKLKTQDPLTISYFVKMFQRQNSVPLCSFRIPAAVMARSMKKLGQRLAGGGVVTRRRRVSVSKVPSSELALAFRGFGHFLAIRVRMNAIREFKKGERENSRPEIIFKTSHRFYDHPDFLLCLPVTEIQTHKDLI